MGVQLHTGEVQLELLLVLDMMHLIGEALLTILRGILPMILLELLQAMITPGVAALNLLKVLLLLLLAMRCLEGVRGMMLLIKELK